MHSPARSLSNGGGKPMYTAMKVVNSSFPSASAPLGHTDRAAPLH